MGLKAIEGGGGSGGGGTSSSIWVEQSSAYTMLAGDMIAANTSGGSFTLKLPATPNAGDTCKVLDELGTWGTNPISIDPNGTTIQRLAQVEKFWRAGAKLTFTYQGATNGWMMDGADLAPVFDEGNAVNQMHPGITTFAGGRGFRSIYGNTGWAQAKASYSRTSGKLYFEFKYTQLANQFSPAVGLATSSSLAAQYPGSGFTDYGVYPGNSTNVAQLDNNGSALVSAGAGVYFAVNDVLGFAVDFGGGSITIYKNNTQIMQKTGLTFSAGAYYLGAGANQSVAPTAGIFSTRAAHCAYTPPSGYSYWDH